MTGQLHWSDNEDIANLNIIKTVEERLKIQFPKDYIEYATINHGGSPSLKRFKINAQTVRFGHLLAFVPFSEMDILDSWNVIKHKIDNRVIPFATANDRGLICFDYRNGHSPLIVYWDSEQLYDVCGSFTTLLSMLY